MKVLIVDDEALVRRSLVRAFKSRSHDVLEASDGNEGFKAWSENNPELVILDVLMPGLTGPEVLQKMAGVSTAKVILISAFSGEHNVETALQMGAQMFIPKPFEDIFSVVDKAEGLFK